MHNLDYHKVISDNLIIPSQGNQEKTKRIMVGDVPNNQTKNLSSNQDWMPL